MWLSGTELASYVPDSGFNSQNQKITDQIVYYDSLNIICPHKLIKSGTSRRCDFVGEGMAL